MSAHQSISMQPIGVIHTDVADEDVARQRRHMTSTIHVFDEFADGLSGIADYSHIIVLFWMDRARPSAQLVNPRGDPELPLTGVFASRGRGHPNAVGLAVAELIDHHGAVLSVRKLDAYDNTPVIDIKPYDDYDVYPNPRVPQWFHARRNRGPKSGG